LSVALNHAVVNAIAHIHIETPRLTKERFVAGGAAAIAVAGGLLLRIRLCFHNRAPKEVAIGLAFHQQAADQDGGNLLGGAGEEGLGEGWKALQGRGGYGSDLDLRKLFTATNKNPMLKMVSKSSW
jgi:hypothetical protein